MGLVAERITVFLADDNLIAREGVRAALARLASTPDGETVAPAVSRSDAAQLGGGARRATSRTAVPRGAPSRNCAKPARFSAARAPRQVPVVRGCSTT